MIWLRAVAAFLWQIRYLLIAGAFLGGLWLVGRAIYNAGYKERDDVAVAEKHAAELAAAQAQIEYSKREIARLETLASRTRTIIREVNHANEAVTSATNAEGLVAPVVVAWGLAFDSLRARAAAARSGHSDDTGGDQGPVRAPPTAEPVEPRGYGYGGDPLPGSFVA